MPRARAHNFACHGSNGHCARALQFPAGFTQMQHRSSDAECSNPRSQYAVSQRYPRPQLCTANAEPSTQPMRSHTETMRPREAIRMYSGNKCVSTNDWQGETGHICAVWSLARCAMARWRGARSYDCVRWLQAREWLMGFLGECSKHAWLVHGCFGLCTFF
jgi:hypothetical protein